MKRKASSTSASAMMKRFKQSESKHKGFRKPSVEGFVNGRVKAGSAAAEIKNFDTTLNTFQVTSTTAAGVDLLSGIVEGTNETQRVGQKIVVRSVDIQFNCGATVGTTANLATTPAFMDLFVVWDKQPDGASAVASVALTSSATNLTFGLTSNLDRFQVLRRERVVLDVAGGLGRSVNWHIPLELAVRYVDTNAPPNTNGLLVYAISPSAAGVGTTMNPTIAFIARVKYIDP